jgi:two-component system, cell cycle sensor histidine kinase and response regulator CckA
MKPDTPLFSRWMKAACVLTLLALAAGGTGFYRAHGRTMRHEAQENLSAIARLKVRQIVAWRSEQLVDAAVLSANQYFAHGVARLLENQSDENTKAIIAYLHSLQVNYHYADIMLVNPDGKPILSLSGTIHPNSVYMPSLAAALRRGSPVIIDLHAETEALRPHISVVAPLFSGTGQDRKPLGAAILISDAAQFLYPLIQTWPAPSKTAETLLIRRDGDNVLFLNDLRHQTDTALKLRIPLSRKDLPASMAVSGQKGIVMGSDYRGVEVAAAILPVPDSPWFMVAKVDAEEVFADWRFQSVLIAAFVLGLTLFAGTAAMLLRQREKKAHFQSLYLSEARLRTSMERHSVTLRSIGDAIIATDAQGVVELLNPVAEALTGWTSDEARGRPLEEIFRIVNEQTREKVENPVTQVLRQGVVVGLANHTLLIARDGTERPIADSGAPIRDDSGGITGVVLVFRDQTAERAAAAELAAREHYYRSMIFNLHEDILVIDRNYCITDINNTALMTLGLKREEVVGRKCYAVSHGLNAPCHENGERCALAEVFTTGKPSNCRHDHTHADGKQAHIDILMSPLKNEDGEITHVIEAARDITDVIQTREALLQSEKKFRTVFEHMAPGCCLDEIIYRNGKAVDYRILDVNPSYERLIGIPRAQAAGALASELYGMRQAPNIEIYAGVDATGEPAVFEAFYEPTGKHLHIVASRIAPGRFCTLFSDITERKQHEEERERLLSAIEQAGEAIVITDSKGAIQYVNPAFEKVTGYTRKEAIGKNPRILKSGKQDDLFYRNLWATLSGGNTFQGRIVNKRKDGTLFTEEATITPVRDAGGRIVSYVAVKHDITEHLKLATQLQQAQKMESVGRLAGGVAHDYNNMLSVILGFAELAMDKVDPSEQVYADLKEILGAAKRSAQITRQLLAFARQQTIEPKVLDLNHVVESMLKMLRRLIGEDIDLSWRPGDQLWPIEIDPSQLEQVMANLCVNARDAIAGVGKMTIETGTVTLDEAYCADHAGFSPGEFALLAVSDDGCGMDKGTLDKIFEPFFTTKEKHKGTGLGLAMVYGIVKQNAGFINVYSEPGQGTTFRIYFPKHVGQTEAIKAGVARQIKTSRGEKVLLVEDESATRKLGQKMLKWLGYEVFAAGTPDEAIQLAAEHSDKIHLLITDVVMPGMNGRDLANRLSALYPGIKTLFMSGYTANVIAHRGVLEAGVQFIQKPFSLEALGIKIREILDDDNG